MQLTKKCAKITILNSPLSGDERGMAKAPTEKEKP
jgi:hypothetical protein